MTALPILYSFRRCPYAMRARMALLASNTPVALREVVLRDKPTEMIAASPKATVPVLVLREGAVIDESLAIMRWALGRNDPQDWLASREQTNDLVSECDGGFKHDLDRYKYPNRYDDVDPAEHRASGLQFLERLEARLVRAGQPGGSQSGGSQPGGSQSSGTQLSGSRAGFADIAIFPFVRQFAHTDRDWFNAQPIPALQKWLDGHLASPLFVTAMKKYPQWKTGAAEPVFGADESASSA